jgi:adenosylcobinamide-phosphate synthase
MWPFPTFAAAALALAVERFLGYPEALQMKIGHPVQWIGQLISKLDASFNRPAASEIENRLRGLAALALLLSAAFIPSWLVAKILSQVSFGWIIEGLIATAFIAQTSLRKHVMAVYRGLGRSLPEGRRAVAKIVGRDPARLDESGIARAALESLAENTADGIVAPALWYALLGLPGLVVYKTINTADSMIGHKSQRYRNFGWAAARLDDVVNLPFSRLAGALFAAAAWIASSDRGKAAWFIMWRDAPAHQSPNAGWPEAALAGALGLKLGGPRSYDGHNVDLPWMGVGRTALGRDDIRAGLRLYRRATALLFALALICALFL